MNVRLTVRVSIVFCFSYFNGFADSFLFDIFCHCEIIDSFDDRQFEHEFGVS